jgi:hypothetical protein
MKQMAKIALVLKGQDSLMILKCQAKTEGDGKQTVRLGHTSLLGGHRESQDHRGPWKEIMLSLKQTRSLVKGLKNLSNCLVYGTIQMT